MLSFGQRLGHKPIKKPFQKEEVSNVLRTDIWNIIFMPVLIKYCHVTTEFSEYNLLAKIWMHYFKIPFDDIPYEFSKTKKFLKEYFFNSDWLDFFELIEFIVNNSKIGHNSIPSINKALERENSAYRLVDNQFTEISNENEIQEIQKAINETPFSEVQTHLSQALVLMNNRENPDFRNSIKESISAVEALAKKITGNPKAGLADALTEVKKKNNFHPAYQKAFEALYGWTSDSNGIRHGLMQESNLTLADARFMLIACSAFVNYLIDITK